MKKAAGPDTAFYLEQIPSIGREIAIDLKRIGLTRPQDLIGKNPYRLYQKLCVKDKMRYDPCMLDALTAAVHFMDGKGKKSWWAFTSLRKKQYPDL